MKKNKHFFLLLFYTFSFQITFAQCYTSISSGGFHVVAKNPDGSIWGWGSGEWGALGTSNYYELNPFIILPTNETWLKYKCSTYGTFVIKSDGTLWGAGTNYAGCLGIGSTNENSATFVQIGTASNWKDIAPGAEHTIAMKTDNTLWGWGQNDTYQMGNNTCCYNQLTPVQISTNTDWKQIATSGSRNAFAIKNNGTLWCWGGNFSAMLGPSDVSNYKFPTQHNPDSDWKEISAGYSHLLALKTNGTLWAWGDGGYGATGDDLPIGYWRDTPRQIGTSTWKIVAAGYFYSVGIKTDGTLWTWGRNWGQLGTTSTDNQQFPTQVGTDNDWDVVSAGQQHIVALKTNGSLWTWGDNFYGQLGDGTLTNQPIPTEIAVEGCALANESFSNETTNLVVTPNPLQNEVTVNYKGNETINTIAIYDILGKIVYQSNPVATKSLTATFPITELQSGTYTLVLKNNDKIVVSKKLVKE